MDKNRPRIKPRIHEWIVQDSCIREKFMAVSLDTAGVAAGVTVPNARGIAPKADVVTVRAATIGKGVSGRVMKSNKSSILAVVLLVSVVSFACSLFTRAEETPTPNYIFTPSTTLLKIEPDSLPSAQTGVAYEVEIRVSDNVTPLSSVSISSGTLPAGLELMFVDGEDGAKISGVPQETGTFTFTVFFSCFGTMVSGQTLEKDFQIVVKE